MFAGIIYFSKMCWTFSKKYIFFLIIKQIINSIFSLLSLIIPQFILDSIFKYQDFQSALLNIFILTSSMFLCTILLNFLTNRIMIERMVVFKYFQLFLGEKMMNTRYEHLESSNFLDLKSKAEKFLYGGGNGFASILEMSFDLLGKILTLIGLVGIIAELNIWLVMMILIIVLFNTFISSKNQRYNIKVNLEKSNQERRNQYFSNIFQDFSFGKEIRTFNISKWLLREYEHQLNNMGRFYYDLGRKNFIYSCIITIASVLQQLISYIYLIKQAFLGLISIGEFSKYLSSISAFSSILKEIINGIISMNQYTDYYNSYKEYMNLNEINKKGNELISTGTEIEIEFRNVYFKYENQYHYTLENICIKIQSKDKIAIVGENGAGKSTFIKLLLRIYEPTKGVITLNGVDIRCIDYNQYMSLFSSVFQDYKFFSFSIRDNIVLSSNCDKDKDREIRKTFDKLGILDRVDNLHKGLDTYIFKDFDNNGFSPSGGESQKLAIARAIFRNSDIIILDEPTASLDPRSEYELYSHFNSLFDNKICLYITHRLASTQFCTKIMVLSKGKIVEVGNHKQLIDLDKEYKKLFDLQASFYK